MKVLKAISFAVPMLAIAAFSDAALAQSQTGLDHRAIPHKVNPSPLGAATAGSTGSLSPITCHGGPVMGTPNVYLIWYGNWNQSNGSDTPGG